MKLFINKFHYIFLIIIVITFEIYTFYIMLNPKTSDHYSLYYIEKKLKFWNHGSFPKYQASTLLTHETIKPYLSKKGWSWSEANHIWTLENSSSIIFKIADLKDVTGIIKLFIITPGQQDISLTINGHFIGSRIINSVDSNISFNFDKNLLAKNSINTIKFEFSNAHKLNNGDQRVFAMALKSFLIE